MASIINASNSGFGGIVSTGDSSGQLQLQAAGTTAVTIDTSQNVGIGTSSPAAKLNLSTSSSSPADFVISRGSSEVAQPVSYSASDEGRLSFYQGDASVGYQRFFDIISNGRSGSANSNIRFFTNTSSTTPTERMRIDSSGNVQIGKTSNSTLSAGINLGSLPNFIASTASPSDGPYMQISNIAASVANGFRYISFRVGSSGNEAGSISTNGSSTVSYVTSSDYRLKENVKPMVGALDVISKLNPVTYTWKIDGSDGQGFIAHELQEVVPDAVTGKKDAVDEEGNIKPQGVDTSFLVATLTAAIQEQQTIINDLKARVETLEAK